MKSVAVSVALLAGCVEPGASTSQVPGIPDSPDTTTIAANVDYYLILDGIKGESTDSKHQDWIYLWQPLSPSTGTVGLLTDCIGSNCHFALADASLQSGDQTADGPTAVWRIDQPLPSLGHMIVRTGASGPSIQLKLSSATWQAAAPAGQVICIDPPDCLPIKGTICVPICTLAP